MVAGKRTRQSAGKTSACAATNLPHLRKHPASLRQCSRLRHLLKQRELSFQSRQQLNSEASCSSISSSLTNSLTLSNAAAPLEVTSGDGVIVSGRKSRPASCNTSSSSVNGFGFSQGDGIGRFLRQDVGLGAEGNSVFHCLVVTSSGHL